MKLRYLVVPAALTLLLGANPSAFSQEKNAESVIIDFEGENPIAGNSTSHKAEVSVVEETPEGGGKFAAKTVVNSAAGTYEYFGIGFQIPATSLSGEGLISFWIKTDIESGFNLQIHSDSGNTSVFPFSAIGSKGKWKQITAPLSKFKVPSWANGKPANLNRINKIQVTAFGSGPYDDKFIILDHFVCTSSHGQPTTHQPEDMISKARRAKLKTPDILSRGELGEMFDGETLNGWFTIPRVYVPRSEKFDRTPADKLYDAVIKHYEESDGQINRIPNRERVRNQGVWKVEEGVVIGAQVPGTIAGAYLMSEEKFGDFELTLEANPDYPIDTGIMVRAHKLGSVGYQVLVDNRPNGTIGGVYGNSVGGFFAYPFVFDADEQPGNKIANIRAGNPNALQFRGGQFQTDFAASLEEFLSVWKPNDWNEIKIRCTGRLPLIETWINGLPIAKIDTATLADQVPGYDPEAIFERIGRKGHIGLEVHDSPTRDRWAPGAECRWRNVRIRELEVK